MFGFSITEVLLIGVVTLIAVGPQRLPGMLKNFGQWMRKLRKMTTDVRQQTGIDEMLRQEGIQGGLNELRSLVRGHAPAPPVAAYRAPDPYQSVEIDLSQEYPPEGPDSCGAMPDDLLGPPEPSTTTQPKPKPPEPPMTPFVGLEMQPPAESAPAKLEVKTPTEAPPQAPLEPEAKQAP